MLYTYHSETNALSFWIYRYAGRKRHTSKNGLSLFTIFSHTETYYLTCFIDLIWCYLSEIINDICLSFSFTDSIMFPIPCYNYININYGLLCLPPLNPWVVSIIGRTFIIIYWICHRPWPFPLSDLNWLVNIIYGVVYGFVSGSRVVFFGIETELSDKFSFFHFFVWWIHVHVSALPYLLDAVLSMCKFV